MNRWAIQRGFTIVELLIVIVIISVLATITIVAYNGVVTNAENNKTVNSVNAYAKALMIYANGNGSYPQYNYPCLGPQGTVCSNVTDGTNPCAGAGMSSYNATFDAAIKTVATSLPAPSTQTMVCNGKSYAGAFYGYTNAGKSASINYFLKGDIPCPSIAGLSTTSRYQNTDATRCSIALPELP